VTADQVASKEEIMTARAIFPHFFFLATFAAFMFHSRQVHAADTAAVLGNGVAINELLIDPNSTETNFDTDQSGSAEATDEFVELFNLSSTSVDISGWELWDSGNSKWFTFPGVPDDGTTILADGAYAVVVIGVQTGGTLPVMTNPASIVFDAGKGSAIFNNGGDNLVLYDPGEDEYIQILFNGDAADDPTTTYTDFSDTAVRIDMVEDWGSDQDGKSLTRYPSGDTNVVVHDAIPGGGNASPTAITLKRIEISKPAYYPGFLIGILATVLWAVVRVVVSRRPEDHSG
jgi:hypothetical protein